MNGIKKAARRAAECQDGTPAVMMSRTGFLLLTLDLEGPQEAYHNEFDKVERWVKKTWK